MDEITDAPVETVAIPEIQTRIADKVRLDSELRRLTPTAALEALFTESDPEVDFGEMAKDDRYKDIQLLVAPGGTAYLYSDEHIPQADAIEQGLVEEAQARIAEKVRENSQLAQLTSLDSLSELAPGVEPAKPVASFLSEMAQDERFQDIQTLAAATGAVFAYSDTCITRNYAEILARVEARNPGITIAETVREESLIYPRPTRVELFREPVFNIDPDELELCIEHTLKQPEFQDIKKMIASTGACYLYSDLHMSEDKARSLVEWIEVEQFKNP